MRNFRENVARVLHVAPLTGGCMQRFTFVDGNVAQATIASVCFCSLRIAFVA